MSAAFLDIVRDLAKLPDLMREIYGDVAKPGAQQIGKALETTFGLCNSFLLPAALLNERSKVILQRNMEKYRQEMASVAIDDVTTVPPEIGVPVIEKLTYFSDHELSELYVNLLAKASSRRTASIAHPSFVNIISNIAPDEAVVLQAFRTEHSIPFVCPRWTEPGKPTFVQMADLQTGLERTLEILHGQNLQVYFENLAGLGLLALRRDVRVHPLDRYVSLEEHYRAYWTKHSNPQYAQTMKIGFTYGRIERTAFGELFIKACATKLDK